jgi:hypothetical protein
MRNADDGEGIPVHLLAALRDPAMQFGVEAGALQDLMGWLSRQIVATAVVPGNMAVVLPWDQFAWSPASASTSLTAVTESTGMTTNTPSSD